ncbi:hypothetical protein SAMN05443252_1095 [Bacillus sp. OV322]|uniref:hypothetical protein n=1 Tax=Bacillus sp. OV322 TaxID=1882764 RepID=UPI0008F342C3|nr:hypothetical protein [Bacillus sp. OV322]SFC93469.1 hypothetical protein SAMN05443252_1095 [Bacillus sp. OV322]
MKKPIWLVGLVGLILFGVYIGVGMLQAEPPQPAVNADGKSIRVYPGSYCWNSMFNARCVDTIGPVGIIQHHQAKPISISPGSTITFGYGKKPNKGSVGANRWNPDNESATVTLKGNSFTAPNEKGTYVYDVFASWEKGSASHVFVVEVK